MKKLRNVFVALTLALALCACGGAAGQTPQTPAPESAAPASAAPARQTPAPAETAPPPAEESAPPEETEAPAQPGTGSGYAAYLAAAEGERVTVESYVQDCELWWDNKITVYAQDREGAYCFRNLSATREEAAALSPGARVRVTGNIRERNGWRVLVDAEFTPLEGTYAAPAEELGELLGSEALSAYRNRRVRLTGAAVEPSEGGAAFLYGPDGDGREGSDLWFSVSCGGNECSCAVRADLRGPGTETYEAVKLLSAGERVSPEGFLAWDNGPLLLVTELLPAN